MYCQECAELMKEVETLKARLSEVQSNSLLAVPLASVDFDTNLAEILLPAEVVAKGFNAGMVKIDLTDVQLAANDQTDASAERR